MKAHKSNLVQQLIFDDEEIGREIVNKILLNKDKPFIVEVKGIKYKISKCK
jgi:hypothetical protein